MPGSLSIPTPSSSSSLHQSVAIPQTAVCHTNEEGSFVWRVTDQNLVVKTPVKTGKLIKNNQIEILSGLSAGERIAVTRLTYSSLHALVLLVGLLFITNFKFRKPKNRTLAIIVCVVTLAVLRMLHIW